MLITCCFCYRAACVHQFIRCWLIFVNTATRSWSGSSTRDWCVSAALGFTTNWKRFTEFVIPTTSKGVWGKDHERASKRVSWSIVLRKIYEVLPSKFFLLWILVRLLGVAATGGARRPSTLTSLDGTLTFWTSKKLHIVFLCSLERVLFTLAG